MRVRSNKICKGQKVLRATNITIAFGDRLLIRQASFKLGLGSCAIIRGANGAGKSSLLRAIAGHTAIVTGSFHLDQLDITGLSATERAAAGLFYVPQFPRLPMEFSESEVEFAATKPTSRFSAFIGAIEGLRDIGGSMPTAPMNSISDTKASMLSMSGPLGAKVILIDEPCAGIADDQIEVIVVKLQELLQHSAVLIVEHHPNFIAAFSHNQYLLENGVLCKV